MIHLDCGLLPDTPLVVEGNCPNKSQHTPCPQGYVARQEWFAKMGRTHRQITCEMCGLWAIWLPKAEAAKVLEERLQRAIEADRRCREEVRAKLIDKRKRVKGAEHGPQ